MKWMLITVFPYHLANLKVQLPKLQCGHISGCPPVRVDCLSVEWMQQYKYRRCAVLDIDWTESLKWCRSEGYGTFSSTMLTGSSFPRKLKLQTRSLTLKYCGAVQRHKWSPTAYDPQTGNDPRCGTQMIPPEKGGMAWSLISWILLFIY